jgi:hypothetical protein
MVTSYVVDKLSTGLHLGKWRFDDMFFHQGLAMFVLVVAADGSVSTDPELALARAMFAREFPDDSQGHTELVLDKAALQRLYKSASTHQTC